MFEIVRCAREITPSIRSGEGPRALILHTYRFAPHSKGDDTRDPKEIERYRAQDPLQLLAAGIEKKMRQAIEKAAAEEIAEAYASAQSDPQAEPQSLTFPLGGTP